MEEETCKDCKRCVFNKKLNFPECKIMIKERDYVIRNTKRKNMDFTEYAKIDYDKGCIYMPCMFNPVLVLPDDGS